MSEKLLVITSDEFLVTALKTGFEVSVAAVPDDAMAAITTGRYDALVADGTGVSFVAAVRRADDTLPLVMLADATDADEAVRAVDESVEIIEKPWATPMLLRRLTRAMQRARLEREAHVMSQLLSDVATEIELTGASPAIAHARERISLAASSEANVLVRGEVGTGKEAAAQRIHRMGSRSDRPLVKVFCSVVPQELIERELFGFDGEKRMPGKLDLAAGGTLMIDEVAELDLEMQSRLLVALRGGHRGVRVVATTRHDLRALSGEGRFLTDLLYLLDVASVEMPALRDRGVDISGLAARFVEHFAVRNSRGRMNIDASALDKIAAAPWRGNVRQLQNVLERAVILSSGDTVSPDDIRVESREGVDSMMAEVEQTFRTGSIRQMEKLMIIQRLRDNDDNRTRSAETLEISVRTLRNKLNEYNMGRRSRTPGTQAGARETVMS